MTSRSNLFGLPPEQQRARAAAADRRISTYEPPADTITWAAPDNLLPTIPGYVAGIVSLDPLTIQCDGCAATETPGRMTLATIWFNPHDADTRRLCPQCRTRAGWRGRDD